MGQMKVDDGGAKGVDHDVARGPKGVEFPGPVFLARLGRWAVPVRKNGFLMDEIRPLRGLLEKKKRRLAYVGGFTRGRSKKAVARSHFAGQFGALFRAVCKSRHFAVPRFID